MMNVLTGISATAGALDAEKVRMDLIAQNIANAQTTRGPDGEPYSRKVLAFESVLSDQVNGLPGTRTHGVRVAGVRDDPAPGQQVYLPGHPHADESGMVTMPNVELSREMLDLISASRAYQANLTAVKTARQMAQQALSIGR